ncbi:MAG: GspE/PulE family protein [Defluviitaleaceae bacterium]|nr:GspE/PulE family protein [Defluviitaleaceae bacterium]
MKTTRIRLAEVNIDIDAAKILGHEYALRFIALPFKREDDRLFVAMPEPENAALVANLTDVTGLFVVPVSADENDVRFYINKIFGEEEIDSIASKFSLDEQLKISAKIPPASQISDAPTVQFLDSLIEAGVVSRASDIHIEPHGRRLRARFRVDGVLRTFNSVDISMLSTVISRLKIIGGMDIAEKRVPQDGHFSMIAANEKIEFRLSTLPTTLGEKAVIRLLYGQKFRLKKEDLGFYAHDLAVLTELFARPHGAIFMTGPTGSGKSTTLNCFLEELNTDARNIVTVEDPVENPILGVSHVNVERNTLSFAGALRHILRQDPDIIMVGEIRDEETARIAVRAAITGHVVLSTLHTNDAAGVIERLCDMGIEPYLIAAALNSIISQRLVRRICRECIRETDLSPRQAHLLRMPKNTRVFEGAGCAHCDFSGFRSRFAVYEYFVINEDMRRRMTIDPAALAADLRTRGGLRKNAVAALIEGRTTADEVIRTLNINGGEGDDDGDDE